MDWWSEGADFNRYLGYLNGQVTDSRNKGKRWSLSLRRFCCREIDIGKVNDKYYELQELTFYYDSSPPDYCRFMWSAGK